MSQEIPQHPEAPSSRSSPQQVHRASDPPTHVAKALSFPSPGGGPFKAANRYAPAPVASSGAHPPAQGTGQRRDSGASVILVEDDSESSDVEMDDSPLVVGGGRRSGGGRIDSEEEEEAMEEDDEDEDEDEDWDPSKSTPLAAAAGGGRGQRGVSRAPSSQRGGSLDPPGPSDGSGSDLGSGSGSGPGEAVSEHQVRSEGGS